MARFLLPWISSLLGWCFLLLGILLVPTPLPIGLVLMLVGLALLAHSSKLVRVALHALRSRWPWLSRQLEIQHKQLPRVLVQLLEETRPRL